MAVPPSNSNSNPNPTPPILTAAQTRALLHTLLSNAPNATQPNRSTPKPKVVRPQPIQQRTITIDASTRIMGHCNNVALASPSPIEQAVKIEQFLRPILQPAGPGDEKMQAAASVNFNVNIQAGVSIMGSKNVVAFSGKKDLSKDSAKGDEPLAGQKRRAESEPADAGKRVKSEASHGE